MQKIPAFKVLKKAERREHQLVVRAGLLSCCRVFCQIRFCHAKSGDQTTCTVYFMRLSDLLQQMPKKSDTCRLFTCTMSVDTCKLSQKGFLVNLKQCDRPSRCLIVFFLRSVQMQQYVFCRYLPKRFIFHSLMDSGPAYSAVYRRFPLKR